MSTCCENYPTTPQHRNSTAYTGIADLIFVDGIPYLLGPIFYHLIVLGGYCVVVAGEAIRQGVQYCSCFHERT